MEPREQAAEPEWDGFRRQRWANRFALLFALTFGTSTGLFFAGVYEGYGRGHQVANLIFGIFALVSVTAGMFLGRLLAWRLAERSRRIAMIMTLVLGLAAVAWSWTIHQSGG